MTTLDLQPDSLETSVAEAARLLRSLANETRLLILCRLGRGEATVGALLAAVGGSQSALSQHLARLREEGLVAVRRDGVNMHYRIDDRNAVHLIATLGAIYSPEQYRKAAGAGRPDETIRVELYRDRQGAPTTGSRGG